MAQKAQKQLESEGLVVEFIHPYDDPAIIAGQGTMGREMMMQAPYLQERGGCSHAAQPNGSSSASDDEQLGGSSAWPRRAAGSTPLDIVIAPVGGGGMLSGVATAVKGIDSRTIVVGAEPKGEWRLPISCQPRELPAETLMPSPLCLTAVDDAMRSFESGVRQPAVLPPQTICDGLLTSLSDLTLAHIERRVDLIATASENNIILALKAVTSSMKQLIEPSAAVGLATLLEDNSQLREVIRDIHLRKADGEDQSVRIGIVWSGGNTTIQSIAEYLSKV